MLESSHILDNMIHYFPSWSDIRKRVTKSTGGLLLKTYSNEFDNIQDAIEEYKKDFFLISYLGIEDKFIDYLYMTLIGKNKKVSLTDPDIEVTEDYSVFYNNRANYALYKDGFILVHKDALKDKTSIIYIVDDEFQYSTKLMKKHIWNVFDEFALFAGLKRFTDLDETNAQLAQRCFSVFKNFANASETGIKNAIINNLSNYVNIHEDEITIEAQNEENLNISDAAYKTIYERMAQFNQDLFRTKKWDMTIWEHPFKKTEYMPHVWDKQMNSVRNGVGSNNSLKIDYLSNINQDGYTDLEVFGYKKSEKAIKEYIKNNNLETNILLELTKYENTIKPEKVQYKIQANSIKKIDPDSIHINALQQINGEDEYYISDFAEVLDGVTETPRNIIDANKKYRIEFSPVSNYSLMNIYACELNQDNKTTDLRKEYGEYVFKNNTIVNKNVLAHISTTTDLKSFSNIKNTKNGMIIESITQEGVLDVDVTDMGGHILNYDISCNEVNITDNNTFVTPNGFTLINQKELRSDSTSSSDNIIIDLKCNSYSFDFAAEISNNKQGSIIVTTIVDNKEVSKRTITSPQTISNSFDGLTSVKIVIQKNGQNPVSIKNISAARYDIQFVLDNGFIVSNSMFKMLSQYTGNNTLHIKINSYSSMSPVIKCVHIGNNISGSVYGIDFDTTGLAGILKLNVKSTCTAKLFQVDSNGTKTLINGNYVSEPLYINNTKENAFITIDTSNFVKINGSSPEILDSYKGTNRKYIIVQPGKTIEKITISGDTFKVLESKTLTHYIIGDSSKDKEVYIGKSIYGFVIKDTTNDKTDLAIVHRAQLNPYADTFRILNCPSDVSPVFVINREKNAIFVGASSQNIFEDIYLSYNDSNEYIAYNSVNMMTKRKDNVEIINTFSPIVSMSTLLFYRISVSQGEKNNIVLFKRNGDNNAPYYTDWALGKDNLGLTVIASMSYTNSSTYEITISQLNNKFIVSNEIPLDKSYTVGGAYHELGEYIINTPKDIAVNTKSIKYEETFIAENDLFNKLFYSNIDKDSITLLLKDNGATISSTNYEILDNEGIVVWENSNYIGKSVIARYSYKQPVSLSFTNFDAIYEIAQYNVEAYDLIDTIKINNAVNGDILDIAFKETPDKIIVRCSNSCFQTIIESGKIKVVQVEKTNKLAVHNGYIYDGRKEYFYFNHKYIDTADRFANVEMFNVGRMNGKLWFYIESRNYLPYSSMKSTFLDKLCEINFNTKRFTDISEFNSMTACESFNGWTGTNADFSLSAGSNGYGIRITKKQDGNTAYAVLDVSKFMKKNNIISLFTSGDLKVNLVQEIVKEDMTFSRSICFSDSDIKPFRQNDKYLYHIINYDILDNVRYYLFAYGTDGVIDDIVSTKYTNLADMVSSHIKNIDKFGFKIDEKPKSDGIYTLEFDPSGAIYDDLEINHSSGEIRTTSSIDYDLTKIATIDLSRCSIDNGHFKKNRIVAESDDATLTTPIVYLRSAQLIYKLYIKINDIFIDNMKNFNIGIYTASQQMTGQYNKVSYDTSVNIAEIPQNKINNYVKVEVGMAQGQVINSIEVYARYIEGKDIALIPVEKEAGSFVSKIYDVGDSANYILDTINYKVTNGADADFYVRGFKEDALNIVPTKWYKFKNGLEDDVKNVFTGYSLFQFKADISDNNTELFIKNFVLKVVE